MQNDHRERKEKSTQSSPIRSSIATLAMEILDHVNVNQKSKSQKFYLFPNTRNQNFDPYLQFAPQKRRKIYPRPSRKIFILNP